MRRIIKAALGGLAGCALVLGGTQAATGIPLDLISYPYPDDDPQLVDLDPKGPFDGASATLEVKLGADGNTNFVLDVADINPTAAGDEFGAHLHTKACDDTTSGPDKWGGPHYNHEVVYYHVPVAEAEISRRTEVWFDLVPGADGVAKASVVARGSTTVNFLPVDPDGVMSIIVHVAETDHKTGLAGARGACFPLDVSAWAPKAP